MEIISMEFEDFLRADINARREYFIKKEPVFLMLENILSLRGGTRLIYTPVMWLVSRLVTDGKFTEPNEFELPGEEFPSECHKLSVAAALYGNGKMFTGFALSNDGYWRVHSWAFLLGRLVEMTGIKRELYYGIELTKEDVAEVDKFMNPER